MGGAISDLVSRVSILEQSSVKYPNMNNRSGLFAYEPTTDSVPTFDNWATTSTADNTKCIAPIPVTSDGYVLFAGNYRGQSEPDVLPYNLSFIINRRAFAAEWVEYTSTDNFFYMIPVRQGDSVSIGHRSTAQFPVNTYIGIVLYRFR